jgi:type IV pilus assembly protein PilB
VAKAVEKLGSLLLEQGVITERQLNDAMEVVKATGSPMGKVLVDMGYATQGQILKVVSRQMGLLYIDFAETKIDPGAIACTPEELARRYTLIPIGFDDEGRLVVAMADPQNVLAIDDLRIVTGYEVRAAISTKEEIQTAIEEYYKIAEHLDEEFTGAFGDEGTEITDVAEDAPIVKLVNLMLTRAVQDGASDIHVEPMEKDLRIRYRIDGVLQEIMRSPKQIQPAVISRFKIMASMDVAESRKPQDGHAGMIVAGQGVDFRVSTLPTVYGERVVLRILGKETIRLRLEDLGFLPASYERFKSAYQQPYGAILVTGPTGSGKSTTLYATLNVLNVPEKNIVTIEDPVEYRLPDLNQIQINAKAGLSFARGLRSILRSSPDIIMVGEIRDQETAQIAIEAALTGHLVLSTLHTNDAPGAITRLTEMGVEPFLTSSAVDCVQAQRLARRLCKECKQEYKPPKQAMIDAGYPADNVPELVYRAKGCQKCSNTGYKGRVGVYEVMLVSDEIERLTVEHATAEEIKQVALAEGMVTLRMDGLEKVRMGMTSIEEVMRVIV